MDRSIDIAWRVAFELWLAVQGNDEGGVLYLTNSVASWTLVYSDPYLRSVAVDPITGNVVAGSCSALKSGGCSPASNGIVVHANGQISPGWITDNKNLAWPFYTFIHLTESGVRLLILP